MQYLCIYCFNGTGYYPFYNQSILNSDTFIYCNRNLEEYLLDFDKSYKPCFNIVKFVQMKEMKLIIIA